MILDVSSGRWHHWQRGELRDIITVGSVTQATCGAPDRAHWRGLCIEARRVHHHNINDAKLIPCDSGLTAMNDSAWRHRVVH